MHEIKLHPYKADAGGFQSLKLGTKDSYGIEQLHIVPGTAWNGLVVTATFVTGSTRVRVVVPEGGIIDVPQEATAATGGNIVFSGVSDGVQRITVDLPYTVSEHLPIDGTDPAPTPSEWEQFVSQVKGDADRAESAAQQAENDAEKAKQAAENAFASEKSSAQSADNALQSKNAAAQSAKDAAAELEKVQNASEEALSKIGTEKDDAIFAVTGAGTTQTVKVENAGAEALKAIDTAKTSAVSAVGAAGTKSEQDIGTAKETALTAISDAQGQATQAIQQAGTTEVDKVNDAGAAQTKAVQGEGAKQTQAVTDAGDAKLAEINKINSLLPTPTEEDAGKAVVVKHDGSGYELNTASGGGDAYTKAESDARYAPIEAAIKVSGKGTGLVSLSPTVGWGMQGLTLYGRSWQDGTPSVENPVPIQSAGQSGSVDVHITDGGIQTQHIHIPTPDGLPGIQVVSGGNWVDETGQQWVSDAVDLVAGTKTQNCFSVIFDGSDDEKWITSSVSIGTRFYINFKPVVRISFAEDQSSINSNLILGTSGSTASTPYRYTISVAGTQTQLFVSLSGKETLSDFRSYLQTHPMHLFAVLSTPVTTPLDAETIAAYKSLKSYPSTTNVLAPDCGIEAAAVAEPNQYIEDKIQAAITQAVAQAVELTGGNT